MSLLITQFSRGPVTFFYGRAVVQRVRHRLTAEARNQSQGRLCEMYGQSGNGEGFSSNTSVYPGQLPFHPCSILIYGQVKLKLSL
jgi:hypothetical protein